MDNHHTIIIIGAGPSGTVAASLLLKRGHQVLIIEKETFPRFSIGESLLCSCLDDLEAAGLLGVVADAGFQVKTGAAFRHNEKYSFFEFSESFTPGKPTTFQVQRDKFDQLLADEVVRQGAEIRFNETVISADFEHQPVLVIQKQDGSVYRCSADFVLDASGYGRVLSRLLSLETPSTLPPRKAIFTHVEDNIAESDFDRSKILITTHKTNKDIWFWTIPFSNGRSSIGVVGAEHYFSASEGNEKDRLLQAIAETPTLQHVLRNSVWDTPVRSLTGYSANVKSLYGRRYALLGNAAEFLDPVFSSGVTIAIRSASLAANLVSRELSGEPVDWALEYADRLSTGIDCFRTYVGNWYSGGFQDVIYWESPNPEIRQMICAVLAGHAWDTGNPFVFESSRRLNTLMQICQGSCGE
ncbi:NAD(P)/FAD-dependent oxidoreductase [Tatumella sp. UBA2305]|uniref:NAD(P)/FAD-dependent oxidoreductase n=1 Tax=Tatumella sp. UBA2305 TaxID=1947647 RepID=UPI0025E7BA51|nr:NAD(P)/FAD-dependent oxidoreductase [Tatumella sp. UBA2305]